MKRNIGIVLAGGIGQRFGGDRPKQYYLIRGKEMRASGAVYTVEVALIEPTSKYYRLVTCTVTVGEETKITKVKFGEIQ